ncbi:uncharacterized protein LOC132718038 isoform X2 [Ruditapes philippinarum]|uniref:uncharacterized protein LOC132718038 isoform X2 n=1 Tax=Ruditapes philippinarum TaxID=129788 RepID=UPI00295BA46C|nr:uncharacterized protein LOC132718038 isoform X2 [Ruditapes philippinarum]
MLLEVNLANRMETATIEQIHRVKQLQLKHVEKLPAIKKLSRDQGLTRTCAFKEFRFEPPFVSRKKDIKKKKLPPIPENMLPKRHNSFEEEEEDYEEGHSDLPTLPSLSISPAFLTERADERSLSVEVAARIPSYHMFNTREFTFPESSAKRKKHLPSQPSIVPALTPRVREVPIQAKIEKLAKQKRKERAKRAVERRYEKKLHNMMDMNSPTSHMAFKSKREPEVANSFHLKEHKLSPFKQMTKTSEESDKTSKLHPRLYTRIVDSIYSYTKGLHEHNRSSDNQGPYERLMVTPVTVRDEGKDDVNRQLTYLPPIL